MARRLFSGLIMLLTLALVGCDHGTKLVAQRTLEHHAPLRLVRGVLDLRYTENHDAAFSLLRHVEFPGKAAVLGALAFLTLAFVAALWWRRRDAPRAEQLAYGLVVAGAVGNLLDRIARGFVVDFIHVHHWPVFNVADVLVGAGVVLLVAARLRTRASPSPSS
ncbi:MAG TPA: signal peptidase II [Minicystis sp.]|nr:signal peptidase II [Minicystis sp.]